MSSVATVLSDLCGPGEWMPMEKLHTEVSYYLHSSINTNADWHSPDFMVLQKLP